jgi:hypothetical protein
VIGDRDVLVSEAARGFDHRFERVPAVGGRRVHVQIAADVTPLDQ